MEWRIIDSHVHPEPVENFAESLEYFLKHMHAAGVTMMLASDLGDGWPEYPDRETVSRANERLREFVLRHPREIQYYVYLNPQLDNWEAELDKHAATAIGIKLWISIKDEKGSMARTIEVLKKAAKLNLPVLIHSFQRTDPLRKGETGVEEIITLGKAVPECRIVAAHCIGNWRRAAAAADRMPKNVWFDVSGGYPERGMARCMADAYGVDRLMFGSDATGRSFRSQQAKIFDGGFSEAEMRKIFFDNAFQLFRLDRFISGNVCEQLAALKSVLPNPKLKEDHFCFAGKGPYWDHSVTAADLAKELEKQGVTAAYPADLSIIYAENRVEKNQAWAKTCAKYPALHALAMVDPTCKAEAKAQLENMAGLAGIWISPYLNSFALNDPKLQWFFKACAEKKIPLWINLAVSDDRFRVPELSRRGVPGEEVDDFLKNAPANDYVMQGWFSHAHYTAIAGKNFRWEWSKLSDGEYLAESFETAGGVAGNLCRGSEYPFRSMQSVDYAMGHCVK